MSYQKTITACFVGYIIQAIVNNFVPLLFLTFHSQYGIPLAKITWLVTINFGIQLLVDLFSVKWIDKIGYRISLLAAHILSALGLIFLTFLPEQTEDAFAGLMIAVAVYAAGGGLLEVLLSPVVEACPTKHKEKTMSMLHSFYCWGHVGVVLLSTLFFSLAGMEHWKILAYIWAVIPIVNFIVFLTAPLASLIEEGEEGLGMKELFSMKVFWLFMVMMMCAGASEQAVSQWASAFAEKGLGVSKTVGDLGCSSGPTLAGMISGCMDDNLRMGILAAIIFPVFFLVCISLKRVVHYH